jgi:hypothetical protein
MKAPPSGKKCFIKFYYSSGDFESCTSYAVSEEECQQIENVIVWGPDGYELGSIPDLLDKRCIDCNHHKNMTDLELKLYPSNKKGA